MESAYMSRIVNVYFVGEASRLPFLCLGDMNDGRGDPSPTGIIYIYLGEAHASPKY